MMNNRKKGITTYFTEYLTCTRHGYKVKKRNIDFSMHTLYGKYDIRKVEKRKKEKRKWSVRKIKIASHSPLLTIK